MVGTARVPLSFQQHLKPGVSNDSVNACYVTTQCSAGQPGYASRQSATVQTQSDISQLTLTVKRPLTAKVGPLYTKAHTVPMSAALRDPVGESTSILGGQIADLSQYVCRVV